MNTDYISDSSSDEENDKFENKGDLLEVIDTSPDNLEIYKFLQYHFINDLLYVYNLVINYIIDNKRILTGGMGLNYALKSKGYFLYDNMNIDYDFYSPTFSLDAYKLVDKILETNNVDTTHCILAMHQSTMRVRYRFKVVADITYMPQELFDKIPTLIYRNVLFVHPCYQIIDQHKSFAYPYKGMPLANITGRWKKDLERFVLISDFYDIAKELENITYTNANIEYEEIDLSKIENLGSYSGYISASYWITKLNIDDLFKYPIVKVPKGKKITFVTDDIKEIVKDKEAKFYCTLLENIPQRAEYDNIELLDNFGNKVASVFDETEITGVHFTSVYLLTNAIINKDPIACYIYCKLYKGLISHIKNNMNLEILFTTRTYGKYNIPETKYKAIKKLCSNFKNKQYVDEKLPKNYYPNKHKEPNYAYDPKKNYFINGIEVPELEIIHVPEECDNITLEDISHFKD
jgi:hypothetical protein